MVTADELMIGNLLYFKGTDMVAKVQLINAPKHFDCRDEYGSFVPNGEYEPIPITEEWLVKLGFACRIEDNEYHIYDGCEFTIGKVKGYYDHWFCYQIRMDGFTYFKYVHQLQNLFYALFQKQLTIAP